MKNKVILDINHWAGWYPFYVWYDFKQEFERCGLEVYSETTSSTERALGFLENSEEIRFRFLMNYSMDTLEDAQKARVRTLSWIQDNVFMVGGRGVSADSNQFYLCADGAQVDDVAYFFDAANPASHIPHWASLAEPVLPDRKYIEQTFDSRDIPLLFVGSVDPAAYEQEKSNIDRFRPELRSFIHGLLDAVRSGQAQSFVKAGIEADRQLGLGLYEGNRPIFQKLVNVADNFLRIENRIRLFTALRGINIRVVSPGFKDIVGIAGKGVLPFGNRGKSPDFVTGLSAMCHAKLMINNLPNYQYGVTERFFNAQARGAAVLSERNRFLEEAYTDGEDVFLYDPYELSDIRDRLRAIMSDKKKLKEVALAGYDKTMERHLIGNRVQEILSRF